MKRPLFLSLGLVLLTAGCTKQEAAAPVPPAASAPPAVSVAPAATASEATPAGQPVPAGNATEMATSNLLTFNLVLKEWVEKNKRVPKDFEELVAAKAFRVVPKPPPGKRFAIDPLKVELILVDR